MAEKDRSRIDALIAAPDDEAAKKEKAERAAFDRKRREERDERVREDYEDDPESAWAEALGLDDW